jgi:hypothetical protein
MRTYGDHVRGLASLETFDSRAFAPDDTYSQQVCDVVLSLALVFNDLKDVLVAHDLLATAAPKERAAISPEVGEYNGLVLHLVRLHIGIVHELTEMLAANRAAIEDKTFQRVVTRLSSSGRNAWRAVIEAVDAKGPSKDPLGKFLYFARNKISFHYDRKEISRGYTRAFLGKSDRVPYISRGDTLATSRFYFADAAAEEYMRTVGDPIGDDEFAVSIVKLIKHVTFAIHEIVVNFVNGRGFGWRSR